MYEFKPIGYVKNEFKDFTPPDDFLGTQSQVVVLEEYADGLFRLEEFERIFVLYVFDRSDGFQLIVHPRGDITRPKRGVFATRSPFRPNPIGLSVVELVSIDGNVVTVRNLDALDGTPVLDIKSCRESVSY